jgi:hypothetical protein
MRIQFGRKTSKNWTQTPIKKSGSDWLREFSLTEKKEGVLNVGNNRRADCFNPWSGNYCL